MILPLGSAADAWDRVRGAAAPGPVLVFCAAPDPDALAAARTLTALLRADLVRYELHPVAGYAQLRTAFDTLVRGDAPVVPRAVLCINCGARVDLVALLGLDLGLVHGIETASDDADHVRDRNDDILDSNNELAHITLYVLDSHRPYHLRNVSSERVCVFDDNIEEFDASALPLDVGWEDEWGNVPSIFPNDIQDQGIDQDGNKTEEDSDDDDDDDDDVDNDDDDDDHRHQGESRDGNLKGSSDGSHASQDSNSDDEDADDLEDEDDDDEQSLPDHASDTESAHAAPLRVGDGAGLAESLEIKHQRHKNPRRRHRRPDGDDGPESVSESLESIAEDADVANGDTAPTCSDDTRQQRKPAATRSASKVLSTSPRPRKPRKRRRRESASRRDRHRRRRRRHHRDIDGPEAEERRVLQEYYGSAYTGMSSACIAHNIALMLRRASVDTLWAGIIGVTYQYLAAAVHPTVYADAVEYCRSQVALLASTAQNDLANGQDGPVHNSGYTQTLADDSTPDNIFSSIEYRLDLVRHWTLHDSLLYSSYTITRLAAWRQTGRRRLMELLATLGIPLKESKQKWCYMKAECKAALDDRLALSVRRFDLGKDIQYDSFVRMLPGHRGKVSAADMVYGLSALLELDGVSLEGCDEKANATAPSSIDNALESRFWRAYDALDTQRVVSLTHGLSLAIMSQKLAAEIGGEVIERRKFVPSGPFRYVFLRDVQCKELFAHPLLLKRLALFLMEAVTRQGARSKPFLVIAPNPARGIWLAVAAMSLGVSNDFGQRFRRAADKNGCQITFAGFDSAVCEIPDGQETEFIRFLHDVMI
jgi:hypothetical protein